MVSSRGFLLILALLPLSHSSFAANEKFEVITRDSHDKAVHSFVELPQLLDPKVAETANFRIVMKTNDEAVKFADLNDEDRLRAGNLIYHLTKARDFFINELHSEHVAKMEQVLVRMNITNGYNKGGHFDNIDLNPNYNNAYSIPPGSGLAVIRAVPGDDHSAAVGYREITWNHEIFFSPSKNIPMREILAKLPEDPLQPTVREVRSIIYPSQISNFSQESMQYLIRTMSGNIYVQSVTRQAGTLLVLEAAFIVMKEINRLLLPENYYLDTGMVPEIIAHEFSHVALSDALELNVRTPVVEGMADYFAAMMGGSPKLAKKIKEFSDGKGKDGSKVQPFDVTYERNDRATADYVLGLLWGIRKELGNSATDHLIWETRNRLNSKTSDIRTGLIGGLIATCKEVCEHPHDDVQILYNYFNEREKQL